MCCYPLEMDSPAESVILSVKKMKNLAFAASFLFRLLASRVSLGL